MWPASASRVRNSGVHAVVEGIGDHGCEYMTGGRVVVLGLTGRNFGAGHVGRHRLRLRRRRRFQDAAATSAWSISRPLDQAADIQLVRDLIQRHVELTGSTYAARFLADWIDVQPRFVKIMPTDYKRVLAAEAQARAEGREPTFAELVGVDQWVRSPASWRSGARRRPTRPVAERLHDWREVYLPYPARSFRSRRPAAWTVASPSVTRAARWAT